VRRDDRGAFPGAAAATGRKTDNVYRELDEICRALDGCETRLQNLLAIRKDAAAQPITEPMESHALLRAYSRITQGHVLVERVRDAHVTDPE
jgi:hypothetical protein